MPVRSRLFSRVEVTFIALYLTMASNAFYLAFLDSLDANKLARASGSIQYDVIWGFLYSVSIFFILIGLPRSIPKTWPLIAMLVGISVCAYGYYGVHMGNILKLVSLLMTIVFGGWVAAELSTDRMFDIFFRLSVAIVLIHFAMYPVLSKMGITAVYDKLQRDTLLGIKPYAGLFAHKNLAATFFVQGIVVGVGRTFSRGGRLTAFTAVGLLALLSGLIISGGISPLLSGLVCIAVMGAVVIYRTIPWLSVILGGALVPGAITLALIPNLLLKLLGRDETLTGRTYVYQSWAHFFLSRPLFGYGYGEAFSGEANSVGDYLNTGTGLWYANYVDFESGLLQILIDFGVLGGLVFALAFIIAGRYSLRAFREPGAAYELLPMGIWTYCFVSSLNEVMITIGNSTTLFFVSFLFAKWFQSEALPVDDATLETSGEGIIADRLSTVRERRRLRQSGEA